MAEAQTTAADLCDAGSVPQFSDMEAGDYGADYIRCNEGVAFAAR